MLNSFIISPLGIVYQRTYVLPLLFIFKFLKIFISP